MPSSGPAAPPAPVPPTATPPVEARTTGAAPAPGAPVPAAAEPARPSLRHLGAEARATAPTPTATPASRPAGPDGHTPSTTAGGPSPAEAEQRARAAVMVEEAPAPVEPDVDPEPVIAEAPVEGGPEAQRAAARLAAQLATGPTDLPVLNRRGVTVTPPTPPFVEAEAPFRWQVALPSSLGRKVRIRVGDDQLDLGGTVVEIDDISDARFKLDVEAALLRRAASARMTVTLALRSGGTVRVSARNAASSRRATAIIETLTYLWTLLGDTAGEDERQILIGKIDRGSEVQVGRLRLTSIGIAWKREPIARWSTIGDPRREDLDVVIPRTEGEPIVVPLTADDAYQLPALIPVLRKRFS